MNRDDPKPGDVEWIPEDHSDVMVELRRSDVVAHARVLDILGGRVVEVRVPDRPPITLGNQLEVKDRRR